jgi:DtxR family Mn-dependent transcriptional regulator
MTTVAEDIRERGIEPSCGAHPPEQDPPLSSDELRARRLAEVLLLSVIRAPQGEPAQRAATAMEHALDPATTEAVCAFLGHPRACPHGNPIPTGECCRTLTRPTAPLVEPLSRLPAGADADVVYLVARDPRRLTRLSSLGLTAGARIHILQTAPATVVRVGHTSIAFESVLADEMYVRRVPAR